MGGAGSWNDASDWSGGIPDSSTSVACIETNGASVTLTGNVSIDALVLGSGVAGTSSTLTVDASSANAQLSVSSTGASASTIQPGGSLVLETQTSGVSAYLEGSGSITNDGSVESEATSLGTANFLQVPVTNASGGELDVLSGTLEDNPGASAPISNEGDVGVSDGGTLALTNSNASFDNAGGTVSNDGTIALTGDASWSQAGGSETSAAVMLESGSTFTDDGVSGSTGSFTFEDGTVSVAGGSVIASGETVTVAASPGNAGASVDSGGLTNDGTLVLETSASGVSAYLDGTGSVTNDGTIESEVSGSGAMNFLQVAVTNAASASLKVSSGTLDDNPGASVAISNSGTVSVGAAGTLELVNGNGTFDNAAGGTVSNAGAISLTGDAVWSQAGGTETGTAVTLASGCTFADGGGAPSPGGSFTLQAGTVNLTGLSGSASAATFAPDETVTVDGSPSNAEASVGTGGLTNDGTLVLETAANGVSAYLSGSGEVTNDGTVESGVSSTGTMNFLDVGFTNGSGGNLEVSSGTLEESPGSAETTTNEGTVTVAGTLALDNGNDTFDNATGGTVSNTGAITLSGDASWSQAGGSVAVGDGQDPVALEAGTTFADDGTHGSTGGFVFEDGTVNVTGGSVIAAGETVTVDGSGSNAEASVGSAGLTNDGMLVLDTSTSGTSAYLTGSGALTNDGTVQSEVSGSGFLNFLDVALTNDGTVTLGAPGELELDSSSAAFGQGSSGTLAFDVTGASTYGYLQVQSGMFSLSGGTADPVLQDGYVPAGGTAFEVVRNSNGGGTFTTVENGWTASYSPAGAFVDLVAAYPTTTDLASSPNPSSAGQPVTYTATVTPTPGGGTIDFTDGGTTIGGCGAAAVSSSTGEATCQVTYSSSGSHSIQADYSGATNYSSSASSTLTQTVETTIMGQGAITSPPPAVTGGTPSSEPSGGAALSGSVNPEGETTTAYFEYGLDLSDRGPGASNVLYDQSTPVQQVGSDEVSHLVVASISGLVPGALYHVRLVATSAAGTSLGPDQTFTTPVPPPPPPVPGQSANAQTVSGTIFIREPSGQFERFTGSQQVRTGTEFDALAGSVQITIATGKKGETQHGTFGGAVFKLTETKAGPSKGLTTLSIVEGAFRGAPSYAVCTARKAGDASAAALSSKTLQLLRASAHGKFRTQGRYSAATVRGTIWTVADRCDGTFTHDLTDSVAVTDFVTHKTIILHAGQSYLARP